MEFRYLKIEFLTSSSYNSETKSTSLFLLFLNINAVVLLIHLLDLLKHSKRLFNFNIKIKVFKDEIKMDQRVSGLLCATESPADDVS